MQRNNGCTRLAGSCIKITMVIPGELTAHKNPALPPPLPLAEELDIAVLDALYQEKIKMFDLHSPTQEAAGLIQHLGDIRLEQALNPRVETQTAAIYLTEAEHYFQLAAIHPHIKPFFRHKAHTFTTYMPAFAARRHAIDNQYHRKARKAPPEAYLTAIRKDLARNAFNLTYVDPVKRIGFVAMHGISLLLAREGRLDYPTTRRERGDGEDVDSFNRRSYSSYSIVDGYKIPTFGSYRNANADKQPHRITVSFSDLIETCAPDTYPAILDLTMKGKICATVVNLLMRDANQEPLQSQPRALLNALGDSLVALQNEALQSIKSQDR